MKKLIAISVVFALVAGVAFAEANVNAEVFAKVTPLQSSTEGEKGKDKPKVTAGGEMRRIRLEVSGQDDNGVFGGYLRIDRSPWWRGEIQKKDWSDATGDHLPGDLATATGNVWWKPIDQFKLLIGGNGKDGFFGADGITRWGFYQVAADGVGVAQEAFAFSASFYGGFDPLYGAILTITPMDALEINLGIPFFDYVKDKDGNENETADKFMKTNAQVAYTIDGIGKLAITYAGGLGDTVNFDDKKNSFSGNGAKLYAYFGLTAIENLGIDIGFGYTLPAKGTVKGIDVTYNAPIAAGLGVSFNAGDFGVKARVQGQFAEKAEDWKGPMVIDFDVLPYYNISDTLAFFFDAGIKMSVPDQGDSVTGWHINPYITVKSSWWAPNFYAGIRVDSDGSKTYGKNGDKTSVNWSVPIGVAVHL
jgi:hypothetical protein